MAKKKSPSLPNGLKRQPKHNNETKFIDFDRDVVSDELFSFLYGAHMTYKDMVLKEPLFDINGARDDDDAPKNLKEAIKVLCHIAYKEGAGYIRFVQ